MNISEYIQFDLEKSFGLKINREIFSEKVFELKKLYINERKIHLENDIKITKQTGFIEGEIIKEKAIFPFMCGEKEKIIKNSILFLEKVDELDLKYIYMLKPKCVLTKEFSLNQKIKLFNIPIFNVKKFPEKTEDIKIELKTKGKEIHGTNFYIDIGYGNYFFYLILPYDSKIQKIEDLNFLGSYRVLKEIIRRLLKVSYTKGYRVRVLICDLKNHLNIGLKKHFENINISRVLGALNLQDTGLGNEKLIVKNIRYLLDRDMEKRIIKILDKLGVKVERYPMREFSNVDEIVQDIPIVWFYSYPNTNKNSLHSAFLNREFINHSAFVNFSILKNLYREIE